MRDATPTIDKVLYCACVDGGGDTTDLLAAALCMDGMLRLFRNGEPVAHWASQEVQQCLDAFFALRLELRLKDRAN